MNIDLIESARARIAACIYETPTAFSPLLSDALGVVTYLKLESWQKTGSFKVRGALNKLKCLTLSERRRGIITASAGNHALGVAYAAQLLEVPATVYVPENASCAKIKALQHYPLTLVQTGADYDAAEAAAWQHQEEQKLTFIHAFDDVQVIAGQGTIGLEIAAALPDISNIIIPVGGGGLISGVAAALRAVCPTVRIIGVQSQASPAMLAAMQAGRPVATPIMTTVADGLAGHLVSDMTLEMVQRFVDDVVLVSEQAIRRAIGLCLEREHHVLEGSAAVGIACLIERPIEISGKTAVILTGRNVDLSLIRDVLRHKSATS